MTRWTQAVVLDLEAGDDKARVRAMDKIEKVLGLHEKDRAARAKMVHEHHDAGSDALDVLGLLGIEPMIPRPAEDLVPETPSAEPLPLSPPSSPVQRAILGGMQELRGGGQ